MTTYAPTAIDVELKRFYLGGPKNSEVERSTLDQVLRYFLHRLGYKNSKVSNVIGALLLTGKVKVLYSNMVERVEFRNPQECFQREDAERFYADFVASVLREKMAVSFEPEEETFHCTQMIPVCKQQTFESLKVGETIRGIYETAEILNVTVTELNHPMLGVHSGTTSDKRSWIIHREQKPSFPFFQLSPG